jgi:hypothetical protein
MNTTKNQLRKKKNHAKVMENTNNSRAEKMGGNRKHTI